MNEFAITTRRIKSRVVAETLDPDGEDLGATAERLRSWAVTLGIDLPGDWSWVPRPAGEAVAVRLHLDDSALGRRILVPEITIYRLPAGWVKSIEFDPRESDPRLLLEHLESHLVEDGFDVIGAAEVVASSRDAERLTLQVSIRRRHPRPVLHIP
jgi:hypothetical protein